MSGLDRPAKVRIPTWLTGWSIGALGLGLAVGIGGNLLGLGFVGDFAARIRPIGSLWVNALQMTVIPLVVFQLLAAITVERGETSVGRIGAKALMLFVGLMLGAGLLNYVLVHPLLGFYTPDPGVVAALNAEVPAAARAVAEGGALPIGEWLVGIVPTNVFQAALQGDILPLLVFTVAFGLAVTHLPSEQRAPLGTLFQAMADAMMNVVIWVLLGTPVAVFSILVSVGFGGGSGAVGVLGVFVVGQSASLVVFIVLLYPVTVLLGRTSLRKFGRAVAPAQVVAFSSRSSLASLPALVEGGKEHLDLPPVATGFVLPLCVSSFKINQSVSTTFEAMFLTHLLGIPFGPAQMGTFLVTVILISFSVAGIPRGGGGFTSLPAYLAVGIPIEVYIVFEAVVMIPDMFMTVFNVTGDMSVATILTRKWRQPT